MPHVKHHPLSAEGDTLAVLDACVLLPPRLSDVLFDLYLDRTLPALLDKKDRG